MSHPLHQQHIIIDGLQYSNWDRNIFEMMQAGGITAVHVTIAYWEDTQETLRNIGRWNQRFQQFDALIMPIQTTADLQTAKDSGKVGIIFGFQNCSPIGDDYALVEIFYQLNVRIMQLTYNNQSLCGSGCYEQVDGGITRFGRVVIEEMNRTGMIIDMSHSGDRSTLEAIRHSQKPITISHANPTFFHPARRNKSDKVLRALAESGGVLGFSLYPLHLAHGSNCSQAEFCAMVAQTAELMGIDHIAIGTDFCVNQPVSVLHWMRNGRWAKETDFGEGNADAPSWPRQPDWIRNAADFGNITQGLLDIGFHDSEVAQIMGGNWCRLFEENWN